MYAQGIREAAENMTGKENTTDEGGVMQQNKYSYDEFVSKPNMTVAIIDDSVTHSRTDTVRRAKNNAKAFGYSDESGNPLVLVKDTGTYVKLGTDGLRHSLNRSKGFIYPVTENIGEILSNSIRLNELVPKDINAKSTYVLIGTAQNESGDLYLVRSIINSYDNELASFDVLYAVNTKKELAANKSPRYANNSLSAANSTISIAELLDYVNRYYPQLLPEDVLKHYGYDARPEGDLGESALYQSRDADYLSAVERGDMQTAQRMVDEAANADGSAVLYDLVDTHEIEIVEAPVSKAMDSRLSSQRTSTEDRVSQSDEEVKRQDRYDDLSFDDYSVEDIFARHYTTHSEAHSVSRRNPTNRVFSFLLLLTLLTTRGLPRLATQASQ